MNIIDTTRKYAKKNKEFSESCGLIAASMRFFIDIEVSPFLQNEMKLMEQLFSFRGSVSLDQVLQAVDECAFVVNILERNIDAVSQSNDADVVIQFTMLIRMLKASIAAIELVLRLENIN
jgi:hypothetical protein